MRFKDLAAITFVVALGTCCLAAGADAQGQIGPHAARQVIEEPSTAPSNDLSSFAIDWRFWTAHLIWTQGAIAPSPMRFTGAASPMTLPDRRWRLGR